MRHVCRSMPTVEHINYNHLKLLQNVNVMSKRAGILLLTSMFYMATQQSNLVGVFTLQIKIKIKTFLSTS